MKFKSIFIGSLILFSSNSFCQTIPDNAAHQEFMDYYDEAHSVYIDGTNRTAGISGLTNDISSQVWYCDIWNSNKIEQSIEVYNDILHITSTRYSTEANWQEIGIHTAFWATQNAYAFEHRAEADGEQVDIMGGMFVDFSLLDKVSVSFRAQSNVDCSLRIDLKDANGRISNYKSSKVIITGGEGWNIYECIFDRDSLYDAYSQNFWGVENGRGPNGTDLWVWSDYTQTDTSLLKLNLGDLIPLCTQAISSIALMVNEYEDGNIEETVELQITDLIIGDPAQAIEYIPFSTETVAEGLIDYNPDNAVLARAREVIGWPTEPIIEGGVVATGNIPAMYVETGFQYESIYIPDYFSSTESLTYSYDIVYGSINSLNYGIDEFGNFYTSESETNISEYAEVEITATAVSGATAIQTFAIEYTAIDINSAPYLAKSFDNLKFEKNFYSESLNFSGYFDDPEGDVIHYAAYTQEDFPSVYVSMSYDETYPEILLTEDSTGLTTVYIVAYEANNPDNFIETSFDVYVSGGEITEVIYAPAFEFITVAEGTSSIDLSNYISPDETLEFSISGETLNNGQLSLNQASGLQSYTVDTKNALGYGDTYAVEVLVSDNPNTSAIFSQATSTVYTGGNMEIVDLGSLFISNYGYDLHYSVISSNDEVADLSMGDDQLLIEPVSTGFTEVTVFAYDDFGGYATESFNVSLAVTGVEDVEPKTESIVVYPTNVTESFYIENAEGLTALIVDFNGSVIQKQCIMKVKETIDISALPSSIYMVVAGKEYFQIIKR